MLTQCLVALQNITKHNHIILYANPKRTAAAFPKSPDRVAVPRLLNLQEAYLVAPERFPNLPQVSKAGLFPQFSKKAADQLPAFGFEYPSPYRCFRVEHGLRDRRNAAFGIGGPVNHATDLRPIARAGTHNARFNRYIQTALGQVFAPDRSGGRRNRLHLGMRRRIVQRFDQVVSATDYPIAPNHHGSDRNLSQIERPACLGKRLAHEKIVFVLYFVH